MEKTHDRVIHSNAKEVLGAFPENGWGEAFLEALNAFGLLDFEESVPRVPIDFCCLGALELEPDFDGVKGICKDDGHCGCQGRESKVFEASDSPWFPLLGVISDMSPRVSTVTTTLQQQRLTGKSHGMRDGESFWKLSAIFRLFKGL